ncbi:hypothetical protein [Dickeya aquatica]|nr:hypothetical protein [Dickeya aquatica]
MRYSSVFMAVVCALTAVQVQAVSPTDSPLPQVQLLQTTMRPATARQ